VEKTYQIWDGDILLAGFMQNQGCCARLIDRLNTTSWPKSEPHSLAGTIQSNPHHWNTGTYENKAPK
jgi:hypothetical protein